VANGDSNLSPPLLVFADDWGRHPSSCQHLIRELLHHRPVTWINTIGTRPPRFDRATLSRGSQKLASWLRQGKKANGLDPDNLRLCNPWMWPWLTRHVDRRLNRKLLMRQLVPLVRSLATPPIAVTTLPIVADIMDDLPVARWVYYCVDDFAQWPGLDSKTLASMERKVIERADVLIAVSEELAGRLGSLGRAAALLTHGVDLDRWNGHPDRPPLAITEGLERPLVVFWGLVDRRIDVAFVRRTASGLERGTVLLVGPDQDSDPELARIPRVARRPAVKYEDLPLLAREAAVLVMPYADLPVTRAMQPLKLKEYLATGKPTVVRDLPALQEWADAVDIAASADEFADAVNRRLTHGLPERQRIARQRLSAESWKAKALRFDELLDAENTARRGQRTLAG
jgi:glycosyltransferase involved in cell wall biosynthesis